MWRDCYCPFAARPGAVGLQASRFLSALLAFCMGVRAAKDFAVHQQQRHFDYEDDHFFEGAPGPIATAALRVLISDIGASEGSSRAAGSVEDAV